MQRFRDFSEGGAREGLADALRLGREGRHQEAAQVLRDIVRAQPGMVEGWLNLGVALEKCGECDAAVEAYGRAIELRPKLAKAYRFMGNALRNSGKLRRAEEAERRAIELEPGEAQNWGNLATTLSGMGRLAEVIECRRKAVELQPRSASAGSALLAAMHYDSNCTPGRLLEEAKNWAARCCPAPNTIDSHENDPTPDRRLRVGLYSGNAGEHPEGRFLRAVLSHLDRQRFESIVYCGLRNHDQVTQSLRGLAGAWRDIARMDDARAESLIRGDKIDLTGHFGNGRLAL